MRIVNAHPIKSHDIWVVYTAQQRGFLLHVGRYTLINIQRLYEAHMNNPLVETQATKSQCRDDAGFRTWRDLVSIGSNSTAISSWSHKRVREMRAHKWMRARVSNCAKCETRWRASSHTLSATGTPENSPLYTWRYERVNFDFTFLMWNLW